MQHRIDVITFLDGDFAIANAVIHNLRKAKESLRIIAPYIGKNFIHNLQNNVKSRVKIELLTEIPRSLNRTYQAIETLRAISRTAWDLSIKCKQEVHAKLILINNSIALTGTANYTPSGMYYQDEIIIHIEEPRLVEKLNEFYSILWNHPTNMPWSLITKFNSPYDYAIPRNQFSLRQRICNCAIDLFIKNKNEPMAAWKVVKTLATYGYNEELVRSILKEMVQDGIFYEPTSGHIKLTNLDNWL